MFYLFDIAAPVFRGTNLLKEGDKKNVFLRSGALNVFLEANWLIL
jgi:hypothetical protein